MLLFSTSLCVLLFFSSASSLNKCVSENGVICNCDVGEYGIEISNCVRPGGWSTWSKWSKCREGTRKRRRTCNNPQPIGIACVGDKVEKQKCSTSASFPEYLFGTWTSWSGWSRCDCQKNMRSRSRECKGVSCEGCEKHHEECAPEECPINKKWSSWTVWTDYGTDEVRYSAWCSSPNVASVDVGFRREMRVSMRHSNWSEWHVHPGVAYRYRLLPNSSISVEHHLLSRSTTSCLPLYFAIPVLCLCILAGFLLQTLISCTLTRCQRQFTNYSYSYDSNPRDYPSYLIRSPKDESFW